MPVVATHAEVLEALKEFTASQRQLLAEQRELVSAMREALGGQGSDLRVLSELRPGQWVRVWGEFLLLVGVSRSVDLYGRTRTWLEVQDDAGVSHSYEAGEHEWFAVDEPF